MKAAGPLARVGGEIAASRRESAESGLPLACPTCGCSVDVDAAGASCRRPNGCGASWPRRDGILSFRTDDYYYGEMPRDDTRALLDEAAGTTVRAALDHAAVRNEKWAWIREYALDDSRADWRFFLDDCDRLIDVGAGYGAISLSLAESVGSIVAVDGTLERLRMLALRARDEGISNVVPIHADGMALPLAQGSADAVVVMGVLEWVGTTDLSRPVEEVQRRFLAEIARVLRPGGQLLLGIENRWGYNYLLGDPDEHTGVWGTNLLPRGLADRRLRRKTGKAFRTYTYGRRALAKLLATAGLRTEEVLAAIPKYRSPDAVATLADTAGLSYYLGQISGGPGVVRMARRAGTIAAATGLAPDLVPTFIVLARRG